MRISDWSSDVCSSDLGATAFRGRVIHIAGIQAGIIGCDLDRSLIVRHQKAHEGGYRKSAYGVSGKALDKVAPRDPAMYVVVVEIKNFLLDVFLFQVLHGNLRLVV